MLLKGAVRANNAGVTKADSLLFAHLWFLPLRKDLSYQFL